MPNKNLRGQTRVYLVFFSFLMTECTIDLVLSKMEIVFFILLITRL